MKNDQPKVNTGEPAPASAPRLAPFNLKNDDALLAAIEQLTPQQRHCVLLRAEGMRYQDIAAVVGTTTQRAAVLVQRGLVRLAAFCD